MRILRALNLALSMSTTVTCLVATAQESKIVDWEKLSLSGSQSQQIKQLESDWTTKYMKLQPDINDHQRRLRTLLLDPKSDPLEIMATNQSIARLKEQLRNEATANYLRKRSVLSGPQQHQLEIMMQQMILAKQQPGNSRPDDGGGFMDAMQQKVRWMFKQQPQ